MTTMPHNFFVVDVDLFKGTQKEGREPDDEGGMGSGLILGMQWKS